MRDIIMLPAVLAAAAALILPAPLEGRIIQKIKKDGTIHLSNVPDKVVSKSTKKLSSKYDGLILALAAKEGIDPYLVTCIVKVESDFNPDAVSPAGAMGLMQIMADTAAYYNLAEPFNPEKNLQTGIRHFKGLLNYFKNDVPLSLAAYHAGLGRVKQKMAIPPIKATIDYVNSVMYYYSGKNDYGSVVAKLYKKIQKDGTILLFSK